MRKIFLTIALLVAAIVAVVGQPANTTVTFNCASVVGVAPMSVALPLTADVSARITGCGFGGSQGTVEICNASSYGGTCVAATVTSWAATDITATINEGSFTNGTTVWVYVTTSGSVHNARGLGPLILTVSGGLTCDATVSTAVDIQTAVSTNLSTVKTVCITAGSYGTVNLFNYSRTALVTLVPATGATVTISPQIGNSDFIRFDGTGGTLTLTDVLVNSCSLNIEFADLAFAVDGPGLYFSAEDCPSTTHNYLVDGVVFDRTETAGLEGRLSMRSANGIIIRNSIFSGIAAAESADGIFLGGDSTNVTVGPGNLFSGLLQDTCNSVDGAHCDVIQLFGSVVVTIKQNFFINSSTFIMAPDESAGPTLVENNVFDGTDESNEYKIQFGGALGLTFRHNTLKNTSAAFDSKPGDQATVATVDNNIIYAVGTGNHGQWKTSNGSGCVGCLFRYTMSSNSPQTSLTGCSGCTISNYFQGTPTFTGGNPVPSSWAGWLLSGGSSGENAGSDGFDVGTLYYGS